MNRHQRQWANLLGAEVIDAPWEGNGVVLDGPPQPASICFGPLAPVMAIAMPVLSAGMTILGGIGQADAQRQAGETAMINARFRQQQMDMQAQQLEQQAKEQRAGANREAATGQREAIERTRKGRLMASRAKAVMSSAGAGIDDSMVAGLLAEGEYAGDVAVYEGEERARVQRNAATVSDYNANAARYSGATAIYQGENTKAAANRSAGMTMFSSIVGAGIGLASKYGGSFGSGSGTSFAEGARYSEGYDARDTLPGGRWGVV